MIDDERPLPDILPKVWTDADQRRIELHNLVKAAHTLLAEMKKSQSTLEDIIRGIYDRIETWGEN